jgi:hypothetical protein
MSWPSCFCILRLRSRCLYRAMNEALLQPRRRKLTEASSLRTKKSVPSGQATGCEAPLHEIGSCRSQKSCRIYCRPLASRSKECAAADQEPDRAASRQSISGKAHRRPNHPSIDGDSLPIFDLLRSYRCRSDHPRHPPWRPGPFKHATFIVVMAKPEATRAYAELQVCPGVRPPRTKEE